MEGGGGKGKGVRVEVLHNKVRVQLRYRSYMSYRLFGMFWELYLDGRGGREDPEVTIADEIKGPNRSVFTRGTDRVATR